MAIGPFDLTSLSRCVCLSTAQNTAPRKRKSKSGAVAAVAIPACLARNRALVKAKLQNRGLAPAGSRFGSTPATERPSNSRVDDVPKPVHLLLREAGNKDSGKRAIKESFPDERATRSRLSQLRKLLKKRWSRRSRHVGSTHPDFRQLQPRGR